MLSDLEKTMVIRLTKVSQRRGAIAVMMAILLVVLFGAVALAIDLGRKALVLSELQAAVLLPQLERLDERNGRRLRAVQKLLVDCGELPGLTPIRVADGASAAGTNELEEVGSGPVG